jgi:hypothetical protein
MAKKTEKQEKEIKEKISSTEIKEKNKEVIVKEIKKFHDVDFRDKKPIVKKKSLEEIERDRHAELNDITDEKTNPTLEKIANAPRIVNLERGLAVQNSQNTQNNPRNEENDFSYIPKQGAEAVKYMPSMEHAEMVRNLEPGSLRTRFDAINVKHTDFMQSESSKLSQTMNYEKYNPAKVKELQEDIKAERDKALRKTMKYETSR